ncbi:MAG TPA: tRNA uridine-5-carboxymethylaminomethyl(34) synthesis GTPase MnmE, partial [Planctomycetes bacterium]|nr:tRNA uridine-5-carboxymethylaminomethyl(34) synthesis GTPase MnmE [Planctomycetota bacterium]
MEEVIFALSSPPPPASLAMIRLDGDAAAAHLQSLVEESDRNPLPILEARIPRMLQLRWDEVAPSTPALAVLWRRGASWTGNEGVEVVLPGATPIIDGVLARLERAGARPATPGEFTRRAFVNGRIDLSRAESVAALIEAEDQAAMVAARRVMDGELAQGIRSVASSLLDVLAITEAG